MINDLVRIVLSLLVVVAAAGIIYGTCAPIHRRSTPSGSGLGRSLSPPPGMTPLERFLAGLGWGLYAALIILAAVYLVMDLHR